jgi:hypothetical protein
MKIGKRSLRMHTGEIRKFKSEAARDNFERMAQAIKHGFKFTKRKPESK